MVAGRKWRVTDISTLPGSVDIAHDDVFEAVYHADLLPDGTTVPQVVTASEAVLWDIAAGVEILNGATLQHTSGDGYAARVDALTCGLVRGQAYELQVKFTNDAGRKWTWVTVLEVEA